MTGALKYKAISCPSASEQATNDILNREMKQHILLRNLFKKWDIGFDNVQYNDEWQIH